MRLSLIGMAGTGKSYWAKRLAEQGFRAWCCDEMIQKRLESMLKEAKIETKTMGEWMGFPYEVGYEDRETIYLEHEKEVLYQILDYLEAVDKRSNEDVVVDTTGSVVYAGDEILKRLRSSTTMVYLSAPSEVRERLLDAYISHPHPMLWRGVFGQEPGETNDEAMARCYQDLVTARERLYEKHAGLTVDYHRCREEGFGVREFLDEIASSDSVL